MSKEAYKLLLFACHVRESFAENSIASVCAKTRLGKEFLYMCIFTHTCNTHIRARAHTHTHTHTHTFEVAGDVRMQPLQRVVAPFVHLQ